MRVEGLETLDYLDNLKNKERFTEQGDAITFESEVSFNFYKQAYVFLVFLILICIYCFIFTVLVDEKVDKVYLSTPTKIAILDHERKRTFVLRKDGLPDAGEFVSIHFHTNLEC